MQGKIVGSYTLVRLVGKGGMGDVYEAVNESIERHVAIKFLNSECARQPQLVARFFNEARATNRVDHPGIVQVHESGYLPDGAAYIVMEYLRGETLSGRLRQRRLTLTGALQVAWQVADAVAAAHKKGIVHRDLKPGNLMLVPDSLGPGGERVKVLDFGIAKLVHDARQGQTASQVVMGTPTYMSPEQCRGAGEVDARADVYSLGAILYEMISGQPPFVAEGSGELIGMHLFREPPALTAPNFVVPPAVVGLVGAMLHKDRLRRPSMEDAGKQLRELAERVHLGTPHYRAPQSVGEYAELLTHPPPVTPPAPSQSSLSLAPGERTARARQGPLHLLAAVAVGGVLSVGGLWFIWKRPGVPQTAQSPSVRKLSAGLDRGQPPVIGTVNTDATREVPHSPTALSIEDSVAAVSAARHVSPVNEDRGVENSASLPIPAPREKPKTSTKQVSAQSREVLSARPLRPSRGLDTHRSGNAPQASQTQPSQLATEDEARKQLELARQFLSEHRWSEAMWTASLSGVMRQRPAEAWEIVGMAACRIPAPNTVKESLTHLDALLHPTDAVKAACRVAATQKPLAVTPEGTSRNGTDWLAKASRLFVQGRRDEAIALAGGVAETQGSMDAIRWMGIAACVANRAERAKEAYRMADSLTKPIILSACNRNGYEMVGGEFRATSARQ